MTSQTLTTKYWMKRLKNTTQKRTNRCLSKGEGCLPTLPLIRLVKLFPSGPNGNLQPKFVLEMLSRKKYKTMKSLRLRLPWPEWVHPNVKSVAFTFRRSSSSTGMSKRITSFVSILLAKRIWVKGKKDYVQDVSPNSQPK